jgi:hypothetical protein
MARHRAVVNLADVGKYAAAQVELGVPGAAVPKAVLPKRGIRTAAGTGFERVVSVLNRAPTEREQFDYTDPA